MALKEMKVQVSISTDGNVLLMVPVNKAVGKLSETKIMIARLFTQDEIDKEAKEAMQQGCRTYKRYKSRIRETR
jgi:DNA topoisomerase VI subunit B